MGGVVYSHSSKIGGDTMVKILFNLLRKNTTY